jgi:hypothetical protein
VTSRPEERAADAELSERVRGGDPTAVRALIERDYAVAVLFARVIVSDGDPTPAVEFAWQQLLADLVAGTVNAGLRAALLARVASTLEAAEESTVLTRRAALGTFMADGDRWEGWWDDPPPAWPQDAVPRPEQVLQALRQLPLEFRELLVLRDVAGLSAEEVGFVLGDSAEGHTTLLESAEEAYLVELDREMGTVWTQ